MNEPSRIHPGAKRAGAEGTTRLRSTSGMSTDVMVDAARRLGYAGLAFSLGFGTQIVLNLVFRSLHWFGGTAHEARFVSSIFGLALSAIVFAISRLARLTRSQFIAVGLAYEVVGGLILVVPDLPHVVTQASHGVVTASWLAAWIAAFAGLIPAPPALTVAAGLVTACMAPLGLALLTLAGAPWPAAPAVFAATIPNAAVAVFMAIPAIGIHRMGLAVARARALGSYRLVERLGAGGMGEVWRAEHHMLSRPAAIKLIGTQALASADGALTTELMGRFEREAQATASLSSPHTVALYDFGVTEDGRLYYVMELLRGLDLRKMVERFGPLPPERAVHLLLQICESLEEAHAAGLVHRDIKPANLHVGRQGHRYDRVKVLDFGLVKRTLESQPGDAQLTAPQETRGTPAFIPPEMVKGEAVDARTDLYAVGCVAFWLLTGRTVFTARTPYEMVAHHLGTPADPPSKHARVPVPAELDRIVLDCLQKDPAARPASARELARRLGAVAFEQQWSAEDAEDWWREYMPADVEIEAEQGATLAVTEALA